MSITKLRRIGQKISPVIWLHHRLQQRLTSTQVLESFKSEFQRFESLAAATKQRFALRWQDCTRCIDDKTSTTAFDPHYHYHTAWAARVLAETKPESHTDISSLLYFSTLVSAFVPVQFYDYRPAPVHLANMTAQAADLLSLPFDDASLRSVSCMHVMEHIGLGRYGDPLDPDGDLKAIAELNRVLAVGGQLLFVVPVGQPRIVFNAHRIYAYEQIISYFPDLSLRQFALIRDSVFEEGLIYNATQEMADAQTYGCGCFWFERVR